MGLLILAAASASAEPNWQLTFSYDAQALSLVKADRIAPLSKKVHTPGLEGAPLRIGYNLDWLGADGKPLDKASFEAPLGAWGILQEGMPCQPIVPANSAFVVRVNGPAAQGLPSAVRLTRTGNERRMLGAADLKAPAAFVTSSQTFSLSKALERSMPLAGPVGVEKIRDTGPDANRFVVVTMGDGYTSANLAAGRITTDAATLMAAFFHKAPWDIYGAATNVYRVDIESNQEGADMPPPGPGIYVDTYLNSSFWTNGIERALALDSTGLSRAYAAADSMIGAGVWDEIFVLVNSTKYGGTGGAVAVTSLDVSAPEILIHEVGHSFGGLAEEYDYGRDSPPANDKQPNVDFHYSGPGLKWLIWVEPGTPLPTPETEEYGNVVGAFEGAKAYTMGIYRPWLNCLMQNLGRPFCPVCQEAHVKQLMNILDLADGVAPPASSSQFVGASGMDFTIDPLPVTPMTYTWTLGGHPVPGATGPTLTLQASDLESTTQILQATVAHPTTLVRTASYSETFAWTATPTAGAARAWACY